MARYGEAFRNRAVAQLLPPESANVGELANPPAALVRRVFVLPGTILAGNLNSWICH
mgnify:CR=1 FL=1